MILKLESDRLMLQVLTPESAYSVYEFYKKNYDFLKPWEPNLSPHLISIEYFSNFLNYEFKNTLHNKSVRYWFSLKTAPEFLIGTVNFQNIKNGAFKSCELGYKIDPDFLRKGLTSEALRTAIKSLEKDLIIHRFEAIIDKENLPSIRLIESLGFVNEGVNRKCVFINGSWKDCYRYSLLEGELV